MKTHRFTYALVLLVLVTVPFSWASYKKSEQEPQSSKKPLISHKQNIEMKKRYLETEYEGAEPTDQSVRLKKVEKGKRYDKAHFVVRSAPPEGGEEVMYSDSALAFAALPVEVSDVLVIGQVVSGEAHLSNDKTNVYSDFVFVVNEILKARKGELIASGSEISVQRMGGYVKYPSGIKMLYRIQGYGMPRVGYRYVLFLKSLSDSTDFKILTGYELSENKVSPLDASAQFEMFRGADEAGFIKALHDAVSNSTPQ